jgi:hypothetical protein
MSDLRGVLARRAQCTSGGASDSAGDGGSDHYLLLVIGYSGHACYISGVH